MLAAAPIRLRRPHPPAGGDRVWSIVFGNAIGNSVVDGMRPVPIQRAPEDYRWDMEMPENTGTAANNNPVQVAGVMPTQKEIYGIDGTGETIESLGDRANGRSRTYGTHNVQRGDSWSKIVGSNPAEIGLAMVLNDRRNSNVYVGETVVTGSLADYTDTEIEQFKQLGLATLKQDNARIAQLAEARAAAELNGMNQREANRFAALASTQSNTAAGAISASRSEAQAIFDGINQDMRETRGAGRGEAYARVARENFMSFGGEDKMLALGHFDTYHRALEGQAAMNLDGRYASWAVREGAAIARAEGLVPTNQRFAAEGQMGLDSTMAMLGAAVGSLNSRGARSMGLGDTAPSSAAGSIHPGRLAAESSEVSQQSVLRALRQADTPESLAAAKLISRGRLDLIMRPTDPEGAGAGGRFYFGRREVEIYSDAFATPTQAAGYATHESVHFMQGLTPRTYNRGHEFSSFRAQGAVDATHFSNRMSDAQLNTWLGSVYRSVPPAPLRRP